MEIPAFPKITSVFENNLRAMGITPMYKMMRISGSREISGNCWFLEVS